MVDLEAIRKAAEAATPKPWRLRLCPDGQANLLEGMVVEERDNWYGEWIATFPELLPAAPERQLSSAKMISMLDPQTVLRMVECCQALEQWAKYFDQGNAWQFDANLRQAVRVLE